MFTHKKWGDSDPIWQYYLYIYIVTFNVGLVQPPTRSVLRAHLVGCFKYVWCSPPFWEDEPNLTVAYFSIWVGEKPPTSHVPVSFVADLVTSNGSPVTVVELRWVVPPISAESVPLHPKITGALSKRGGKRGFRGLNPWDDFLYRDVSKNEWYPPNHPWINRVFHYFNHPFWGKHPYFWKHPYINGCLYIWKGWKMMMIFSDFVERRWYIIWNFPLAKIDFGHSQVFCRSW